MNREMLREKLFEFTSKELLYRESPEKSLDFYKQNKFIISDEKGNYVFNPAGDFLSGKPSNIFDNYPVKKVFPQIALNKQSRFGIVPSHRHSYLELFYVYSGQCTGMINGQEMSFSEGDVCIMDMQTEHVIYPTGDNDIILNCSMNQEYFNLQFFVPLTSSGPLAQFLAEAINGHNKDHHYLLFHTQDNSMIQELFENAFCEYIDPGICSKEILDSYMLLIFIQLARCYQSNKEKIYKKESKSFITEALNYIEQNFASCTLEETASKFGFHPNYLSRALKNATSYSFKELVDQNRLRHAGFLLKNSRMSIQEIAITCGWSNQTQFYKKFHDGYGISPKEFRTTD